MVSHDWKVLDGDTNVLLKARLQEAFSVLFSSFIYYFVPQGPRS